MIRWAREWAAAWVWLAGRVLDDVAAWCVPAGSWCTGELTRPPRGWVQVWSGGETWLQRR